MKRVLVICDKAPTPDLTAGLVIEQLGSALQDFNCEVTFVVLASSDHDYFLSSRFAPTSIHPLIFPATAWKESKKNIFSYIFAFIGERIAIRETKALAKNSIINLIGRENPDAIVWVVESQNSILVASSLINNDTKNYVVFWDNFDWWFAKHGLSRNLFGFFKRKIQTILKYADYILVPTVEFGKYLQVQNDSKIIVFNPYFEHSVERLSSKVSLESGYIHAVLIGQLYGAIALEAILKQLQLLNWRVDSKKIKLHYYGRDPIAKFFTKNDFIEDRIVIHPFLPAGILTSTIKQYDFAILPYFFNVDHKTHLFSFPSKGISFMSAQLPILFVGAADSPFARIVHDESLGYVIDSSQINPEKVTDLIRNLVGLKSDTAFKLRINNFYLNFFSRAAFYEAVKDIFGLESRLEPHIFHLEKVKRISLYSLLNNPTFPSRKLLSHFFYKQKNIYNPTINISTIIKILDINLGDVKKDVSKYSFYAIDLLGKINSVAIPPANDNTTVIVNFSKKTKFRKKSKLDRSIQEVLYYLNIDSSDAVVFSRFSLFQKSRNRQFLQHKSFGNPQKLGKFTKDSSDISSLINISFLRKFTYIWLIRFLFGEIYLCYNPHRFKYTIWTHEGSLDLINVIYFFREISNMHIHDADISNIGQDTCRFDNLIFDRKQFISNNFEALKEIDILFNENYSRAETLSEKLVLLEYHFQLINAIGEDNEILKTVFKEIDFSEEMIFYILSRLSSGTKVNLDIISSKMFHYMSSLRRIKSKILK